MLELAKGIPKMLDIDIPPSIATTDAELGMYLLFALLETHE